MSISAVRKLRIIIQVLRPAQWLKNILLLFPPFFGGKLFLFGMHDVIVPLVSFSLAASSTYVINDISDRHADRNHKEKKHRVIARGDLSVFQASVVAVVLYVSSMLVASQVSERFQVYLILYLVLSVLYTLVFKHIFLLDIFIIASGYLLRVLAGGEAFRVPVSHWLFLTVFIVALFLASGKRRGELVLMGDDASVHRKSLSSYSGSFVDGIQWFCAAVAIVTYALYAIENKNGIFYSVPLATYGLLRYIYVVRTGQGDPTEVLLRDWQILSVGVLWVFLLGLAIY